MPAPYLPDFRRKVPDSYLKNGSLRKTAERFEVSYGFVQSLTARYRTEETIEPKPHRSGNPPKVRPEHHSFLKKLIEKENGLSPEEICSRFQNKFSVKISVTAMHEPLKRLGISRKKSCHSTIKFLSLFRIPSNNGKLCRIMKALHPVSPDLVHSYVCRKGQVERTL